MYEYSYTSMYIILVRTVVYLSGDFTSKIRECEQKPALKFRLGNATTQMSSSEDWGGRGALGLWMSEGEAEWRRTTYLIELLEEGAAELDAALALELVLVRVEDAALSHLQRSEQMYAYLLGAVWWHLA